MKQRILLILATAFFCSLFISPMDKAPVVMNICTGALCVWSLVLAGRLRYGWASLILFAWTVVSALLSHHTSEGWSYVALRLPLLAFPLSVGRLRISEKTRADVLRSYAVVVVLGCLACFGYALARAIRLGDTSWLYDDALTELSSVQSVYVAVMVAIAVFIMLVQRRPWMYPCIAFLLVFHVMLASRIGLVSLYGLMLVAGIYELGVRRKQWGRVAAVAGALAACGVAFVFLFPKTLNRFRELKYTQYDFTHQGVESHYDMPVTADQWNGANIRLAVWKCAATVCERHFWTGVPVGDKKDSLVQSYRDVGFTFAATSRRNTHNTYLEAWLSYGAIGAALFIAGFVVVPLIKARGPGRIVVALLAVAMITETYLDRSVGCVLLCFWISFVLSDCPPYTNPRPGPYPRSTPAPRDA
jgi:O-antigen ligase